MQERASDRGMDRVALVTGCSTGIGNATARALASAGWTVFAGLRGDHLACEGRLRAEGVRPLPLDVTDPEQRQAALDAVYQTAGRLDALVNNAGIDSLGALEDQPEQALREVMEVNFFGALALTRLVLPRMRAAGHGTIVMVSSLSGLLGLPGSSAYCASKFALEGASEALRNEVSRFGIRVALVEPGGYASAMSAKRGLSAAYPAASAYLPMLRHLADAAAPETDPAPLAQAIVSVIESGAPSLRYPGGAQAEHVAAHLASLGDGERQAYAREVTDLAWWNDGQASP